MSAESGVFVTGATGFLGIEVVRGLLARGIRPYVFARGRSPGVGELREYADTGRVTLLSGDLRNRDLGLAPRDRSELARNVRTVIHCAAVYRLSVGRRDAMDVNVGGLRNLLEHIGSWPLEQFVHVSSITVAGDTDAKVPEELLPPPARFRNFYEESKWKAEALLAERVRVPTRIFRPGIIVGHSATGKTQKLDGPYASFGLMRRAFPFPLPGLSMAPFPLVNVDLVSDAVVHAVDRPPPGTEVIHALDLDLLSAREFFSRMRSILTGRSGVVSIPEPLVYPLMKLGYACRITGVEPEASLYPAARWTFETSRFRAYCEEAEIPTERLRASLETLARHYALRTGRKVR